jgi:hypothetical protein
MEVDGQAKTDEAQGLASMFSAEKILQMRNKVQKNLKHQTKPPMILSQMDAITDPLANFPFADADESCTALLPECEVPSSSRTQLYTCINSFDSINGYFVDIKVSKRCFNQLMSVQF